MRLARTANITDTDIRIWRQLTKLAGGKRTVTLSLSQLAASMGTSKSQVTDGLSLLQNSDMYAIPEVNDGFDCYWFIGQNHGLPKLGGDDYQKVKQDWLAAGKPANILGFITDRVRATSLTNTHG